MIRENLIELMITIVGLRSGFPLHYHAYDKPTGWTVVRSCLALKCLAVDGPTRSMNGGARRCCENNLVSSVSGLMEENREPLANGEIGDGARQQTPGQRRRNLMDAGGK